MSILILSNLLQPINKNCLGKEIEDCYTNIYTFPEEEFDSNEDFLRINAQIKYYYEQGKSYIESMINNSLSDDMKNTLVNLGINDPNKSYLYSKKFFILFDIIKLLNLIQ